jgi:hypothetical protein
MSQILFVHKFKLVIDLVVLNEHTLVCPSQIRSLLKVFHALPKLLLDLFLSIPGIKKECTVPVNNTVQKIGSQYGFCRFGSLYAAFGIKDVDRWRIRSIKIVCLAIDKRMLKSI